jgi:hypothetical protein
MAKPTPRDTYFAKRIRDSIVPSKEVEQLRRTVEQETLRLLHSRAGHLLNDSLRFGLLLDDLLAELFLDGSPYDEALAEAPHAQGAAEVEVDPASRPISRSYAQGQERANGVDALKETQAESVVWLPHVDGESSVARIDRLTAMGRKIWPHLGPMRVMMIEGRQTKATNCPTWICLRTTGERSFYTPIEFSDMWHHGPEQALDALEAALTTLRAGMRR